MFAFSTVSVLRIQFSRNEVIPDASFLMDFTNDQNLLKKVREKSRERHNHKPQPFPKRKRKPTNLNKHIPNKRTKSTKISSLFPKQGNRNTKRTEKHKNKMTHGKTYNKSPRRINHKATRSKTNTGTFLIFLTLIFFLGLSGSVSFSSTVKILETCLQYASRITF